MTSVAGSPSASRCFELPAARGPLSRALLAALRAAPGAPPAVPQVAPPRAPAFAVSSGQPGGALPTPADPLADDDLQLALYLCYELHYSGLAGVDERWEWEPSLLAFRGALERSFEAGLHAAVPPDDAVDPAGVGAALHALVAADGGPPLSRYVEAQASEAQVRELLVHRSAYQLKEADPHSWALPRLAGAPKAALVEVQADEYGGGTAERIHATLFAKAMTAVGLDPAYGAYVERLPGVTLATVNAMSLFGLHRRLRGAIVGHLAAFEMTSSLPNRRYGNGLRRLGFGAEATDFFDEHVEADAVHEQIAAWDLAGGLAAAEPELAGDIVWGARVLLALEARWARHLLDAWEAGEGSLLPAR
jgi:heme oxygenase-like protein